MAVLWRSSWVLARLSDRRDCPYWQEWRHTTMRPDHTHQKQPIKTASRYSSKAPEQAICPVLDRGKELDISSWIRAALEELRRAGQVYAFLRAPPTCFSEYGYLAFLCLACLLMLPGLPDGTVGDATLRRGLSRDTVVACRGSRGIVTQN